MNISLTPELESYIHEKVTGGMYTSASEVIRESLRLMHSYDAARQQRIVELNRVLEIGLEQLDQGQHTDSQASREKITRKIDAMVKGE